MELSSTAFSMGEPIPPRYACEGANLSPGLTFIDVPRETHSLVLVCEDSDSPSGSFAHWVLFNIPPRIKHLPEAQPHGDQFDWGSAQGINDFRHNGYDGPCPPRGQTHHYHFRLFALKDSLDLAPGSTRAGVLLEIADKIITTAELVGTYKR